MITKKNTLKTRIFENLRESWWKDAGVPACYSPPLWTLIPPTSLVLELCWQYCVCKGESRREMKRVGQGEIEWKRGVGVGGGSGVALERNASAGARVLRAMGREKEKEKERKEEGATEGWQSESTSVSSLNLMPARVGGKAERVEQKTQIMERKWMINRWWSLILFINYRLRVWRVILTTIRFIS